MARVQQTWRIGATAAIVALWLATPAPVNPRMVDADPAQTVLTEGQRADAVREIETVIRQYYVFADLREPIVKRLETARTAGRYDVNDPVLFARRVSEDLKAVSDDGHLYLRYDPAEFVAANAPSDGEADLAALRRERAIRTHYGLTRMAILAGNIRYLKITGFQWVPDGSTAHAYDEAAAFLADGDAVIVDLRGNGGGESDAADYFLDQIVRRGAAPNSIADPAKHKPFYILTDGFVGSAAEAVSYSAKLEKRATIVGATSYGAANNNRRFPVAPGFILSVSYHRPINPISGTNWEGVGVSPEIATDPLLACYAAQIDAIDRLVASPRITDEQKSEYRWLKPKLVARLHPVKVPDEQLTGYAGHYGAIELRLEGDGLHLYRPDRPHWPQGVLLMPIAKDGTFALRGTDDIRVRLTGTALELLRPGENAPELFRRGNDTTANGLRK